ncbi:MAG: iron ABC transporter substrate-binding protein [Rhodospirillaceae bacterium]|nr:iron ABC transporter substrate-binding protein [Rhodospirillaceae bacterium]
MIGRNRCRVLCAVIGLLVVALPATGSAREIADSAGRPVEVPDRISRVFAAGPPAAVLVYMLAPETMIGWPRAPREAASPFLVPSARALPELGRLTGRGDTLGFERLMAAEPDIVVDFGSVGETYRSLADRVTAQTGIPYLLVDGRFDAIPQSLRLAGDVLGVGERGEALAEAAQAIFDRVDRTVATVPDEDRPRVYLARGREGLETGTRGSINTEIIERVGGVNVAEGLREKGGIVQVSPEQVIAWAPDTIIALDRDFTREVGDRPAWRPVPAVRSGRVFTAPALPFSFVDFPPSLNRLVGMIWLLHVLYPDRMPDDLGEQVGAFYTLFYQVDLSDADIDRLLGGG